jgi:AraC-like DNA-binding protein
MNSLKVLNNMALYEGILNQNKVHAHHAMQLTISRKDSLTIQVGNERVAGRAILIDQKISHQIIGDDVEVIVLLFEPILNDEYRITFDFNNHVVLDDADELCRGIDDHDFTRVLEDLLPGIARRELDQRVRDILVHISQEEHCTHSLEYFEAYAGLSKSRISHLFSQQIGVSLKYYLLWKKCLFAIDSLRASSNLSEIALDCGFSDLSHFSRTFKTLFGHKPSEIFQNSSSVQVDYLE